MKAISWKDRFQQELGDLETWYQSEPRQESLLFWALKKGYIGTFSFMDWAQSQQPHAFLRDSFLENQMPEKDLAVQHSLAHFPWTPEFLPVSFWQGTLYVAGLLPPEKPLPHPGVVFVYASTEILEQLWNLYQLQNAPVSAMEFPQPMHSLQLEESSELQSHQESDPSEHASSLELLDPAFIPPAPAKASHQEHQSFEPDFEAMTAVPSLAKKQEDAFPSWKAEAPVPQNTAETNDLSEKTANDISIDAAESSITKNAPVTDFDVFMQDLFEDLHGQYKKGLLLRVTQNKAIPWKWDKNFMTPSEIQALSLMTPSIFRIVSKTKKPYHGYVVLNDINEKFFDDWNQTEVPDHITITPVILQDTVVAMLMGFGDKSIHSKASLQLAEKLSSKIVKVLKSDEALLAA